MSAKNRKRADGTTELGSTHEYYRTPDWCVESFLDAWAMDDALLRRSDLCVLDPCAGGDPARPTMPYPAALAERGIHNVVTVDIREDSSAKFVGDFLTMQFPPGQLFDLIITNPPFTLVLPVLQRAVRLLRPGGRVAMLSRMNLLAGQKRAALFRAERLIPFRQYVSAKRPIFRNGTSDATDYAHFVWVPGLSQNFTLTRII